MAVNLIKIEKEDNNEAFEESGDTSADGSAAFGFYPQTSNTSIDANVGIERSASGDLNFKDSQVPLTRKLVDQLLEATEISTGTTYTPTYTSGQITLETWTVGGTNIKTIAYTYSGSKVSTEVRKVFASNGTTIIGEVTLTYNYTGSTVTSITQVRNV